MSKNILDEVSAWAELERFAAAVGVEMDDRAHPDYRPEPSDSDDEESKPSDYSTLLKALRRGWVTIGEDSSLSYTWVRVPAGLQDTLTISPLDDSFPYGRAMRALSTSVVVTHKGRRKSDGETVEEDKLGRLDAFLEIASKSKRGSLLNIRHKRDRDIATAISAFMVSE